MVSVKLRANKGKSTDLSLLESCSMYHMYGRKEAILDQSCFLGSSENHLSQLLVQYRTLEEMEV
jgi:hypothetical protein